MKNKVLFIGDTNRGNQAANIYRLFRLFCPVFNTTHVKCAVHISPTNKLTNPDDWIDNWYASLCNTGKTYLERLDLYDTAIVGFEIPEKDRKFLNEHHIPWVNLEIHPLRFLNDLHFNISSSFDYDLGPLSPDRTLIDFFVNRIRLRYRQIESIDSEPVLAIIGQAPFDKSLFFDGVFKTLGDYFDQIDTLVRQHKKAVYRPHPYLSDKSIDRTIFQRFSAEACTEPDIYKYFCSGRVATVCAISSSSIVEAPYFGLRSQLLEPRAKKYGVPVSYPSILDEHNFWLRELLGIDSYKPYRPLGSFVNDDYLRSIYGAWGFVTHDSEMEKQVELLQRELLRIEDSFTKVLNSYSWRMTKPLRWLQALLK